MVAYQQPHLTLDSAPRIIDAAESPEPATNATRYLDDTCRQCGAELGISGAHAHDGTWWHRAAICVQFGVMAPDRADWGNVFAEPIVKTRLVDGRCAWCRKGGA